MIVYGIKKRVSFNSYNLLKLLIMNLFIKKLMSKKYFLLICCFLFYVHSLSFAGSPLINKKADFQLEQKREIKGKVTNLNGDVLAGVTVSVKDTEIEVKTDEDGYYSLDGVSDNSVLTFSLMGYKKEEVNIENRTNISISLTPVETELDQVVVVGYGTEKKENLTGAITTVNMEDKEGKPLTNVSNALYGSSGLYVNLNSSQPGVD